MFYGCAEHMFFLISLQTEIAKRLSAILVQIMPFLSPEHQQQVAAAVDRAKQVTMTELNAIIGAVHAIFFRLKPEEDVSRILHLCPRNNPRATTCIHDMRSTCSKPLDYTSSVISIVRVYETASMLGCDVNRCGRRGCFLFTHIPVTPPRMS
ncbi:unnamed protein product [Notodromas monacha]|uniref:Groucho/TLE N-terminal Q-rich domain-containing protein n=1 Tax=Notodromas monacha TaxID=399045 RepID=A0A7R9BDD6_9CRUS|nr:unnamed protein product [Notodromas monacha]CAG0912578.1 unnamed protein product [Notodromas monacha]